MKVKYFYITDKGKEFNLSLPTLFSEEKKVLKVLKKTNEPLTAHKIQSLLDNELSWYLINSRLIKLKQIDLVREIEK